MQEIYSDENKAIRIEFSEEFSSKFVSFAENIVLGNEGLKFNMRGLAIDFKNFSKPYFVSLFQDDELIAISIFNHKKIVINSQETDVFYSCLWGTESTRASQGWCTLMINQVTQYLFENYHYALIYAYVESNNIEGKRVVQKTGFRSFADFKVASAIRFFPHPNNRCHLISPAEKSKMISLLDNQHKTRTLYDAKYTFDENAYFVYNDNDKIKAGLQVKKMRWSILSMKGMRGNLLLKIYPKIPFMCKLFDPSEFTYLCIGNIYFTDDLSFEKLMSAVMHYYGVSTCITYGLSDSPIDAQILSTMSTGLLSSSDANASMYVKSNNVSLSSLGRFPFLSICDSI